MRFIADGPDIPDSVRHALEDDNLVLFCGAGISMSSGPGISGMPSFAGLVEAVIKKVTTSLTTVEKEAYGLSLYDRTLHLLEARFPKATIRQAVVDELTIRSPFDRHQAVLELARTKGGFTRLVTTNFDSQFDLAAAALGYKTINDIAPRLPVPKKGRWNSTVYLHGKIEQEAKADDQSVQSLVYTSGDFGLAYLVERWASRFVTDLFKTYPVLFIGYSLDDPVMRYLMDAFTAERQASKHSEAKPAWAFAPYTDSSLRDQVADTWRAKGIEPILYHEKADRDHSLLYESLSRWGQRKKFGLTARIQAVERASAITPVPPYQGDPEVEAVRWALEEPAAVMKFAQSEPPAPIEWLPVLVEWGLLGVSAHRTNGATVANMPTLIEEHWAEPLHYPLLAWITKHLDKPELLSWVLNSGLPHPELQKSILGSLNAARRDPAAPVVVGGMPRLSDALDAAWRLIAHPAGRNSAASIFYVIDIQKRLQRHEQGITIQQDFIRMVSPVVRFKPTFYSKYTSRPGATPSAGTDTISDYIDADIGVASGEWFDMLIDAVTAHMHKDEFLAAIADDLTTELKRILDCFAMMGEATSKRDPGPVRDRPVQPDSGERYFENWTRLIDLTREAGKALRTANPVAANALVLRWKSIPYPLFQRLALHAYTLDL